MAECKDLVPSFCGAKMQITIPDICNEHEPSDEVCEAIICESSIACDDEPSNKICEAVMCEAKMGCNSEPSSYTCQALTCQSSTQSC